MLLIGILAVLALIAALVLDETVPGLTNFFNGHQLTASITIELLLLVATVALIERVLANREAAKWEQAARIPLAQVKLRLVESQLHVDRWLVAQMELFDWEKVDLRRIERGLADSEGTGARLLASRDTAKARAKRELDDLQHALTILQPLALSHASLIDRYAAIDTYLRDTLHQIECNRLPTPPQFFDQSVADAGLDPQRPHWLKLIQTWPEVAGLHWARSYFEARSYLERRRIIDPEAEAEADA